MHHHRNFISGKMFLFQHSYRARIYTLPSTNTFKMRAIIAYNRIILHSDTFNISRSIAENRNGKSDGREKRRGKGRGKLIIRDDGSRQFGCMISMGGDEER